MEIDVRQNFKGKGKDLKCRLMCGNNENQEHIFLCSKLNKAENRESIKNINSCNLSKNREAVFILKKKLKKRDILYRKIVSKKSNEAKKKGKKKIKVVS